MNTDLKHYADNFIPVIPVDYLYHSPEHPFCYDLSCYCHTDPELIAQVKAYYDDGLLTAAEAEMMIKGRLL